MQNKNGLARQAARALGRITALFLEEGTDTDYHMINTMSENELKWNIKKLSGRTIAVSDLLGCIQSKNDATNDFIETSKKITLNYPFILSHPITTNKPSVTTTFKEDSDYDINARNKYQFTLVGFWKMFYLHGIDRNLGKLLLGSENEILEKDRHYVTYVELEDVVVAVYIYGSLNTRSWALRVEDVSHKKRKSIVQLPLYHLFY